MEKNTDDKNKNIENDSYRSLTSEDVSWYLKQKQNNEELKQVKHVSIDLNTHPDAKKLEPQILEAEADKLEALSTEEEKQRLVKRAQLSQIASGILLNDMKEALKTSGNKDFCKKLLISNTDGLHTYAFTYGRYNNKPFVIAFSNTGAQAFNLAMVKAFDMEEKAVYREFKDGLYTFHSVSDDKSCGIIALKTMKYLKFENVKRILDNPDKYTTRDKQGVKNLYQIALPRKLVQYVQSLQSVKNYDDYYDKDEEDKGKYPGTVLNKLISNNRIQPRKIKVTKVIEGEGAVVEETTKLVNTTAEEKQKKIINRGEEKPVKTSLENKVQSKSNQK